MRETKRNQSWVLNELTRTIDTPKFLGKCIPTGRMLNRPLQFSNKNSVKLNKNFSSRWDKYLPVILEVIMVYQRQERPRPLEHNNRSTQEEIKMQCIIYKCIHYIQIYKSATNGTIECVCIGLLTQMSKKTPKTRWI